MRDANRYDARGYLVRLIFGCKPQVFELPGEVEPQILRFKNGVSILDPSMSEALEQAAKIASEKRQTGDERDGTDETRSNERLAGART